MALTEIPIELSSTPSIVDNGNATAITIGSDESATFAGPVKLTAGALAAAGNAGLSHRSTDNKVYLQAGTGGFNILDDQQNTHFFIDSAGVSSFTGNVGIGNTAPGTLLHVGKSTTAASVVTITHENADGFGSLDIDSYGSATFRMLSNFSGSTINGMADDTFSLMTPHTYPILFGTAGVERMRILSGGNVGIGTSNPVADFVVSNGGAAGIELQPEISTDTNRITNFDRAASAYMNFKLDALTHQFLTSGTERLRIDSAGNITQTGSNSADFLIKAPTDNASLTLQAGASDSGAEGAFVNFLQNTTYKWQMGMNTDNTFRWYNYATSSEAMKIETDGIIVHNGVSTYSNSVSMMNNVAYSFDIPVGNEGGSGNVIEVHAMYDHYFNFAYGASLITLVGKRGTNVNRSDIKVITSTNGGAWSVSAPNATTLRLTKSAGSYGGGGFGHIMVRFRKI